MVDTTTKKTSTLGRLLSMMNRWTCASSKNYMRRPNMKHTWQEWALTNFGSVRSAFGTGFGHNSCDSNSRSGVALRRKPKQKRENCKLASSGYDLNSGSSVALQKSKQKGENGKLVSNSKLVSSGKLVSNGYDSNSRSSVALRKLKRKGENGKLVSNGYDSNSESSVALRKPKQKGENGKLASSDYDSNSSRSSVALRKLKQKGENGRSGCRLLFQLSMLYYNIFREPFSYWKP